MERGLCFCGCGQKTALAIITNTRRGDVKGQPVKYVSRHSHKKCGIDFVVADQGYDTPCHIWQKGTAHGYGVIHYSGQRQRYAHIVAFEDSFGPVPEGKELDHLCRIALCRNPEHVEAVTHVVNLQRGTTLNEKRRAEIRTDIVTATSVLSAFYDVAEETIRSLRKGNGFKAKHPGGIPGRKWCKHSAKE